MQIPKKCLFCIMVMVAFAQNQYFVAPSNSFNATAYNNSHKIVPVNGDLYSDTIHVVYHSSDTIYYTYTTNGGQSWQTPAAIYAGIYPALDVDVFGLRHLAWQYFDSVNNNYEIYYDCLDDWSPPMNVSESPTNSILPDLLADSLGVIHICWADSDYIYYRTCHSGVLGDTFRLSDFGSEQATYSHPSMSIFEPNHRVYVVWECYDVQSFSPHQIHYRYKENNTWSMTNVWASHLAMRHPSIDFSRGAEGLSLCYEDSTSGNMDATFYGGNGGGHPTQGRSTYPVISTVGSTWSYLFWQEDSAGYEDIYCDLYYFMTGWAGGSLRTTLNIQEPVRFPNTCGAYLIWTQGVNPPYSIYFVDFGYPIGIAEIASAIKRFFLIATPNPFRKTTKISLESNGYVDSDGLHQIGIINIYDRAGRLVKRIKGTRNQVVWSGDDDSGKKLPVGIYFCTLAKDCDLVTKIIKLE